MSLPVVLRPDATADLVAARDWYEQRRSGLGAKFVAAMDKMVSRIEATPELYAVVLKNVRRGKLRRFPYVVYYRVLADRVEVIAILHGSRDQRAWQSRL
jgi:toxin ParE1/3/4